MLMGASTMGMEKDPEGVAAEPALDEAEAFIH
jgi:hypothetical protein